MYTKVVESLGGFWDAFPWVAWLFMLLLNGATFAGKVPAAVEALVGIIGWALDGLVLIWIIFDVLYRSAPWWWILVCLFCPLGFLIYWFKGREGP